VAYVVAAYALVIGALAAYGLLRAREARRLRRSLQSATEAKRG
jgi:hypothetical protein